MQIYEIKILFRQNFNRIYGVNKFPHYSSLHEDNIIDWLTGYKKNAILH